MDIITKIVEQVNGWKDVPELDFLELGKKEFPEDAFLFEGCTCPAEYEDTYELVASLNKLPEWLIANDGLKRLARERERAAIAGGKIAAPARARELGAQCAPLRKVETKAGARRESGRQIAAPTRVCGAAVNE